MKVSQRIVSAVSTAIALALLANAPLALARAFVPQDVQQSAASSSSVGTVKAISGDAITVTPDKAPEVNVQVKDSARIVRIAPGETSLKNAVPIALSEIQAGDRIVVRGALSTDGKTLLANSVIAVKKADVAQKKQQDLQDWQKRGSGGLVKSVDPAAGTVAISISAGAGPSKELTIRTTKATTIRRYSPDSVKYDDARLGLLDQVKPGDQLRARGTKNAEGTEMSAEEIVSGGFRNVAGLITGVDAEKKTITVNDLTTKKPITIRIADDSQMHRLPQMAAMMLAARLKGIPLPGGMGGAAGAQASNAAAGTNGAGPQKPAGGEQRPEAQGRGQFGGQGGQPGQAAGTGGRQGAPSGGDMQQMLNRMPAMQFADFVKGDAVMLVATEGSAASASTAITLLSGVEPILTASPTGAGTASLLSPWNLGGGAGGDAAAVPQ